MKPLAFFREKGVLRILERAARAAGMPLSVHYMEGAREGARVLGIGECAICRLVREAPGGVAACRASRGTASVMALRQARPIPFVCHMGLACTAAPILPDESFALVLGPFCPSEETRSLEHDVTLGWNALTEGELEKPPVSLGDIHLAPSEAGPAVAEWMAEALQRMWTEAIAAEEAEESGAESHGERTIPKAARVRSAEVLPQSWAADVASALAGANQPRARGLLRDFLEEQRAQGAKRSGRRQAGVLSGVAGVLDAMERAGLKTEAAWKALPRFVQALHAASKTSELLDVAMAVLGAARREAVPRGTKAELNSIYPALDALARERLEEGLTLEEAARHLGESPSAISHRMKRRLGMSFSEYLGRLRIDKAKRLLRRTRLTATEIAHRVGVRDQSHFSKLFKKFEGTTPLEYRSQFGKKS